MSIRILIDMNTTNYCHPAWALLIVFHLAIFNFQFAVYSPHSQEVQSEALQDASPLSDATNTTNGEIQSADWPLFRGDAASTGVARSELPQELDVLWEFKVKKGAFEGTAAIVTDPDDPGRQVVYIGDLDGKVHAIDLKDGQLIWEFGGSIGFGTAPAVKDGKIFIGDLDGIFYCLDSKGNELWRYETEGEINSSANFFEEIVIFGSQDVHLYALHRETGELKWKYESKDQIRCSITVAGDRAFVSGCDGYFHVVNLNDGTGVGTTEIYSPTGSTPAALGSMVYFGNQSGQFFAVDSREIKTEWIREPQSEGDSIVGGGAVTSKHVVFGSRSRNVVSLNPKTGEENWKVTLKAKVDSSPVIVGECVYVGSTDGRLYALSLSDGAILWERQFAGGLIASPAVAFGRLVIGTNRGSVYCLGAKND